MPWLLRMHSPLTRWGFVLVASHVRQLLGLGPLHVWHVPSQPSQKPPASKLPIGHEVMHVPRLPVMGVAIGQIVQLVASGPEHSSHAASHARQMEASSA